MMRRLLPGIIAVVFAYACACGASAGEVIHSRAMSGWFNVTGENGWKGRRYMDGDQIFAEEFATGRSGRIDVWRFYHRGVLSSEERDTNGDGKVDLQQRWDPRSGLLTAIMRDTNRRGINDLEIERTGNNRWEIREDRNLDGVTDRILHLNAPNDFFDGLDINYAGRDDVVSAIPTRYWREVHADDGFTGSITDYYRYNGRGTLVQYGEWDGRRIAWRRCPPDFVPMTASAPPAAATPPPPSMPDGSLAGSYRDSVDPYDRPSTSVRDPFDLERDHRDVDPYAGMYGAGGGGYSDDMGPASAGQGAGYPTRPQSPPMPGGGYIEYGDTTRYADGSGSGTGVGTGGVGRGAIDSGPPPAVRRGSSGDLGGGDSSARAIPARMRAPGTATRRR